MRISGTISITGNIASPSRPLRSSPSRPLRRRLAPVRACRMPVAATHPNRRAVGPPTPHQDPLFWKKIFSVPADLVEILSPNCKLQARSVTKSALRELIQHFVPCHHVPRVILKAKLIRVFRTQVLRKYGPFHGLWKYQKIFNVSTPDLPHRMSKNLTKSSMIELLYPLLV